MEAELQCSIDECTVMDPITLSAAQQFSAGDIELIGPAENPTMLGIVASDADGATQRAADVAAGIPPKPGIYTPILKARHVKVMKQAGIDTIAIGTDLLWWPEQGVFVTGAGQITTGQSGYRCAFTVKLSDDVNDKVEVIFDGVNAVQVAGSL
jgi:hypothetical protein